jgi:hypothetical protein
VPAPQTNGDVVNKGYVDSAVVAVGEGSYVKKNGDTMTGPLTLAADPNAPMQASTRHYVDTTAASLVPNTALSATPSAGLAPQAGSNAVLDLGWLGSSAGNGDKLLGKSGGSSGSASWWTLPTTGSNGCSGSGDKLLYNSTTHALTCGADLTGGGGVSWPFLPPNDNLSDIGDLTHRLRALYVGTSISTPKLTGISDTSVVSNLNSDLLDGKHASDFLTTFPALTVSALGGVKGTGSSLQCSGSDKLTGFAADGSLQCGPDQSGAASWPFLPPNDNLSDIGDLTHRLRALYVGTSISTPKLTGVSDTSVVSNLNSDLLDGKHASDFLTTVPALTVSALGGVKGTGSTLLCSGSDKMIGFGADGSLQCGPDQSGTTGWPLLPPNDNLSDIGDSAHELRSVYVGTSVAVAGGTAGTLTIKASPSTLDIGVPGKALRLGTFTAGTSGSPADANFQIFSNSASSFKGSLYFDAGNDAASSVNFRTGQGGTVVSRLAIANGGAATFSNGDVTISGAYKLNTPKIAGVTDTGVVTNLNSDMVDGKHSSAFALAGFSSVAYSATPTFDAATASTFKMTLTGDVSSATLANAVAGQMLSFVLCQDAAGNHNFTWPSNVKGGMAVGVQVSKCSAQAFVYDGTQAWALGVVNQ